VNIHSSAVIEESVIGPYVTIGQDCKITRSIIRNSIIDAGAEIVETIMDQSLVGKEAIVRGRYRQFNVGDSALVGYSNTEEE
jgi:glucose-1-phosphate thymidylyltransferase